MEHQVPGRPSWNIDETGISQRLEKVIHVRWFLVIHGKLMGQMMGQMMGK